MMAMNVDIAQRNSDDENGFILQPMLENERGADMLRAGKHEPALRHFVLALEAIQGWLSSPSYHNEEKECSVCGEHAIVTPTYAVASLQAIHSQVEDVDDLVSLQRVPDGSSSSLDGTRSFLIWIEPFTFLQSTPTGETDMSRDSLPTGVSCCTLFNMALLFHLRGNGDAAFDTSNHHDGSTTDEVERTYRPIHCRKAVQLYKQCLELLEELPPFQDGTSSASWLLFEIAVWNSLCHCYQQLFMEANSRKCLEKLLKILMMVLHGTVAVRSCDTLLEVELDLLSLSEAFLENALGCSGTAMTALPA